MNDDLQVKTVEGFRIANKKLEEKNKQREENVMMLDSIVENKSKRVSELEEIVRNLSST